MLLVLALVRLFDLRQFQTYRSMFKLSGSSRLSHRCANIVAAVLALIPLMQLNARIAQGLFSSKDSVIAPYEIFGANHYLRGQSGELHVCLQARKHKQRK